MHNFRDGADKPQLHLHTYIVQVQCRQNSVVFIYILKSLKKARSPRLNRPTRPSPKPIKVRPGQPEAWKFQARNITSSSDTKYSPQLCSSFALQCKLLMSLCGCNKKNLEVRKYSVHFWTIWLCTPIEVDITLHSFKNVYCAAVKNSNLHCF